MQSEAAPIVNKIRHKVRVLGFGFWVGAFVFICFLSFIRDGRGMSALDAIMQAINPAWVPEIVEPTNAD